MVRFAPRAGRVISIHAPQWGATGSWNTGNFGTLPISIHAPQWGATAKCGQDRFGDTISIHAPQWGATSKFGRTAQKTNAFQSTHPSGVRPLQFQPARIAAQISIHAPQWGATQPSHARQVAVVISIHAPQWGATAAAGTIDRCWSDFNPRTPVGCDFGSFFSPGNFLFQSTHPSGVRRYNVREVCRTYNISIHAPQWGATPNSTSPTGVVTEFQSTHPSGVRLADILMPASDGTFQSTHPSGVRRGNRPRVDIPLDISIHAPQWGATIAGATRQPTEEISIHAPQWGATSD